MAATLSVTAKKSMLLRLSEDDFRDKAIRPLYRRMGYSHVRDTCGPDERGADCLFLDNDKFGAPVLYAIQTKKGKLTLAATTGHTNVAAIGSQIQTALQTSFSLLDTPQKLKPTQVHVCASGDISNQARDHILSTYDPRQVRILSADELLELLDKHFPEFWLGSDANRMPYLRSLRRALCAAQDVIRVADLSGNIEDDSPVLDANYVALRVSFSEDKWDTVPQQTKLNKKSHVKRPRDHYITTTSTQSSVRFRDIPVQGIPDQSHKLSVILGEGGAGKTTALRRIAFLQTDKALNNTKDKPVLPVFLRAHDLSASGDTLLAQINQHCTQLAGGDSPFTTEDFESGRVTVLIDGLDELNGSRLTARQHLLDCVLQFNAAYPKCPVVVSARDYRAIVELPQLSRFKNYRLLPVRLKEAETIVVRALQGRNVDPKAAQNALRRLEVTHGMSLSPMLITAFVSGSDFSKQDVPPNIAEIFRKFTEQLLGRWDDKKGLSQQYELQLKDHLLQSLAFEMHSQSRRSILRSEVETIFSSILKSLDLPISVDGILEELIDRSGILRTEHDSVLFRHLLLQEFYAGKRMPATDFLASVIDREQWRNAIVFHFGSNPSSFDRLEAVKDIVDSRSPEVRFDAAITIGLASQACYLSEAVKKGRLMIWVMETLGACIDGYRSWLKSSTGGPGEAASIVVSFLHGRDSVATRLLASALNPDAVSSLTPAAKTWRMIGLIDCGEIATISDDLKRFIPPTDTLTFALHNTAAWRLHLGRLNDDDRDVLLSLCDRLTPRVSGLYQLLHEELRAALLEVRVGKIVPASEEVLSD